MNVTGRKNKYFKIGEDEKWIRLLCKEARFGSSLRRKQIVKSIIKNLGCAGDSLLNFDRQFLTFWQKFPYQQPAERALSEMFIKHLFTILMLRNERKIFLIRNELFYMERTSDSSVSLFSTTVNNS